MRGILTDQLQVFPFYVFDIAPIEPMGVPVLTPFLGFSTCTAPEIVVETTEIQEGNWYFSTAVVKSAVVQPVTLTRGATFFDADFYRWISSALAGDISVLQSPAYGTGAAIGAGAAYNSLSPLGPIGAAGAAAGAGATVDALRYGLQYTDTGYNFPFVGGYTYRRDLMLVQFFAHSPVPVDGINQIAGGAAFGTLAGGADGNINPSLVGVGANAVASGVGSLLSGNNSQGASTLTMTNGENTPFHRLPAKAWILRGCLPTRYKASTDFDASSSDVSIQELELAVDIMEEISLAG